jgi:hypothetical protein
MSMRERVRSRERKKRRGEKEVQGIILMYL